MRILEDNVIFPQALGQNYLYQTFPCRQFLDLTWKKRKENNKNKNLDAKTSIRNLTQYLTSIE